MSQSSAKDNVLGEQTDKASSDLTSLPDYIYQPLLPGEDTRVVRILPSTNVEDDIICKIEHIAIGDDTNQATVPYEALSYVCGPDHPPQLVQMVDGTKLSVRPNLLDALKLLRSSTEERVIWVDQISIHQRNPDELARQVRNFGRIFHRAISVSIVIRESDPSVAMLAFPFLFSLAKKVLETHLEQKVGHNTGEYLDALLDLPPANDSRWSAVTRFLENEWFFRAWTLQELVLAKKATFLRGPYSLSVAAFMLIASIWTSFPESQLTRNYRLRDGTLVFRRIAYLRSVAQMSPERLGNVPNASEIGSLLHLLSDLRSLRCFDKRDKIWTIISIAKDYDERTLPVDYHTPWQSIYTKVCHWLCDRHHNLGFLQLVETKGRNMQQGSDQNRPEGLPSWVPSFHIEPDFLNTLYLPRVVVRPKNNKVYYASGSSQVVSQGITAPELILKCRGLKIGVIKALTNPAGNLKNAGTGIGEPVPSWWRVASTGSCCLCT